MNKKYQGNPLTENFGSNVFNDSTMRERLPKETYKALKKTIDEGASLDLKVAEVVANAMKDWAIERGATHYTHWFQPMTGMTAEKHESFISPTSDGRVIMEFSGKELIKGESDASSFPSGGLRATFEARGYTAWDCTSPAFLKEDANGITLYIPTAFCSYTGDALDKKTPLLRSMEAISKQALRILRLFGNTTAKKVITTVGAEQEYFLVDKKLYEKRKDLIFTGRTLFGAMPPKGQEKEDHYYGSIKERVAAFMQELDIELWKLGVPAKTKHNEVAPAQFEIAPIFDTTNVAADHNQLIMETLKKVADRHGLACLLHEKPFAGVNGSGKHNNWSLSTDDGKNLLKPGRTPHENIQFLLFLTAIIKAVDVHADLLRVSAANAGNDHRLGANEAPPAIISIFLGDQLTEILEQIEQGCDACSKEREILEIGVSTLPQMRKDTTDRNRTSPFAFTGNKFEFRMVPSSASISDPNVVTNTIVADVLCEMADELEKAEDFDKAVRELLRRTIREHKRVIFNGNGYSKEWIEEAAKRGLPNISSTVEAIPALITDKAIRLFEKHKVFSKTELCARFEILLEDYINTINIEAKTMVIMAKRQILPACIKFSTQVAESIAKIKDVGDFDVTAQVELLEDLTKTLASFKRNLNSLEEVTNKASSMEEDSYKKACYYRDEVCMAMKKLREDTDHLETLVDADMWPIPTYSELLFQI
ncbi:MAG: glutamine synthetase [Epulopiscium sp.]|nr:glutamine synthetase III [Defluviitalea raffinosedens]MBM7686102.1 glutamine synthetase [Defluviitalea raffinosedens]MBZ4669196.1 glutamine synthetase catalytic region [Defluviitaleaceae bacterium]MDK2788509.1 glutamine synthetase [Candidatus Epulonipiscium sp.]